MNLFKFHVLWSGLSSGFLLIFSYPPFDAGWLAWVALVPWLLGLEALSAARAFLLSYLLGLAFFGGTVWWIGYVTIPGVLLLVAYLALFFAAWGWWAHRLLVAGRWSLVFGLPAAWALLEYIRSFLFTGFGWNLLAHTQWHRIPLIQMADVTGVYGVSFLVVLVNGAFYLAIRHRKSSIQKSSTSLLIALASVGMVLFYGSARLRYIDAAQGPFVKIAILQGNIPQREKWSDAFQEAIWKRYEALTGQAVAAKPDLIIWPETSVPGFLEDPPILDRLQKTVQSATIPFLVGIPTSQMNRETGEEKIFNSALLVDSHAAILDRYDKVHLVPFGEYLPLAPVLGWLRKLVLMGQFSPGHRFTVFHPTMKDHPEDFSFSVLVCFEDLFPDLSRRFIQEGARWLVVITNDAWFERSAASIQHLQASVFRAVEQHACVVRAANTGWSGFVDPAGRLLPTEKPLHLFQSGVGAATLKISHIASPYARWGNWFILLCAGLAAAAFFPRKKSV